MTSPSDRRAALQRWRRDVRRVKAEQLREVRHQRHQVWVGQPRWWHRASWVVADVFDHAWARGLLWGLFLSCLLGGFAALEYSGSAEQVVEQSVIVSVEESTTQTVGCGRYGLDERPAVVVTYRVQDPRPGLPDDVFTYECGDDGFAVGDEVPLVRPTAVDDADGEVFIHPIRSWGEVLSIALLGPWPFSPPLIAFVLATAWYALQDEVRASAAHARWTERARERELARWRHDRTATRAHREAGPRGR